MKSYHKFLQKQIKKHLTKEQLDNTGVQEFVEGINSIIVDYERDKEIMNNAFNISNNEFTQINENLKNLLEVQNNSFQYLLQSVKTINPDLISRKSDIPLNELAELLNTELQKNSELEDLNKTILESALNAILYFDKEGNIKYWNPEAEKIFGYTNSEALNMNFFSVLSKECQLRFGNGINAFLEKGDQSLLNTIQQSMGVTKAGKTINLELYIIPLETQTDGVLLCAFIQDKTESIQSQLKLKEQERRYRNIIDNINLGLIEVDNEERVQFMNDSFTQISGFSKEDLMNQRLSELLTLNEEDRNLLERKLQERLQGISDQYEIQIKNKKGQTRWWIVSGSPLYDDEGKLKGSIGLHLDVTEKKKLEYKMIEAKEKAEHNSQVKESILTTMSHEIRTPLNGIIGMLDAIKEKNWNPELNRQIDYSLLASNHLLSIVNNILDYSKLEAGLMKLNFKPHSLTHSIEKVASILSSKLKEKNLEFKVDCAGITDYYLYDYLKVEQILFNVVGNAIKFTDKGNISVSCYRERLNDTQDKVKISIQDTGIGMEKETLDKLFSKFTQADVHPGQNIGTGLGMAITKELTSLMGGKVEVKSQPNEGSLFTFTFVFERVEVEEKTAISSQKSYNFAGKKILVVDDNELNRYVAENALMETNAEIEFAETGEETLDKVLKNDYDIVLLDLFLPDFNGNVVTEKLRSEHQYEKPIIGMSANIDKRYIDECLEAGMDDYVFKPFEKSHLFETINSFLKTKSDESLYSLDNLKALSRGNQEFIAKMIGIFIKNSEEIIQKLEESKKEEDIEKLKFGLHKIKPSVITLQVDNVSKELESIESYFEKERDNPVYPKEGVEKILTELSRAVHQLTADSKI